MRTYSKSLRGAVVVLLVGSACLFAVGSTIERHQRHHESKANSVSSGESGESSKGKTAETANGSKPEVGVRILGVDTESVALEVLAVVASLGLAAAVWLQIWPLVILLGVAGFGLVFAAGDLRELVHQLDESNNGLAAVAGVVLALHAAVAALAALAAARRPLFS